MFERLSVQLLGDEDWDAAKKLVEEYRKIAPDDLNLAPVEAEIVWRQRDYEAYAPLAHKLLHNDELELEEYERLQIENQMISSLLRLGIHGPAYQYANAKRRQEKDVALLAMVSAASGNVFEAKNLALEAAREKESATDFYFNDDTATIFLGEEFRELHDEFPVDIPFAAVETVAVVIFEGPHQLAADDLYEGLKKHGLVVGFKAQPVHSTSGRVTKAYTARLGNSSVWAAAGTGKFDKQWQIAKDHKLASVVEKGDAWIAVGTATLTEQERPKVEEVVRSITVQIARKGAKGVYLRGPRSYLQEIFPAEHELLEEWETTGRVKKIKNLSALLTQEPTLEVAGDREFMRSMREAVGEFEAGNGATLEVVASVTTEPELDPLRLQVTEVHRTFGDLRFRGVLKSDSKLVPELRAGLPMEFASESIEKFQVNDDLPVKRQRGS
jgi:hypothetical protein